MRGTIALGESYMDGWWDCEAIDQFIYRLLKAKVVDAKTYSLNAFGGRFFETLRMLSPLFTNRQTRRQAAKDVQYHYNLGNDLFEAMLDKRMNYSCGYWKDAKTLDEAQEAKLELVCKKLNLRPGMTVLDIGCGWGGFAKFAAEKYGVKVKGITLSQRQYDYARIYCKNVDVEIEMTDYRDLTGKYDCAVSIEMFEHVGPKNHRAFMNAVEKCLKPDGLFLLQFDGKDESVTRNDRWIEKYVFPNSVTPSPKQVSCATEGLFSIVDWQDFTKDYHTTMLEWYKNFDNHWPKLKQKYDERFYRMWKFYLLCCPATALANTQRLWQIVLIKKNSDEQYNSG
ncbi:MAG: cyclopropane fatty acyl phospholipid synthase [Candidatus Woesearchaeota archaeon]|nr:cyclopropane fatty acyl phospholipid synthase [Candidatus Woesearchaeota archaeon]MDP7647437.1 cyclopropane fatty acyl phospholipid synthase [Candidatus Woesearchaeota archaeon]